MQVSECKLRVKRRRQRRRRRRERRGKDIKSKNPRQKDALNNKSTHVDSHTNLYNSNRIISNNIPSTLAVQKLRQQKHARSRGRNNRTGGGEFWICLNMLQVNQSLPTEQPCKLWQIAKLAEHRRAFLFPFQYSGEKTLPNPW